MEVFPLLDYSCAPDLDALRSFCTRFDLVVANTLVMWPAVRAAHEMDVPVIWYIHETLLLWHLIELSPEIQSTLALADLIVLPTRHAARLYAPLTQRPIEVVPYGIPPVKLPAETEPDPAGTHFLLLDSYEHRKVAGAEHRWPQRDHSNRSGRPRPQLRRPSGR